MSTEIDDFLPLGGHLLPQEYQEFLISWNRTIAFANGSWLGVERQRFKAEHPEQWKQWVAQNRFLLQKYRTQADAVKAYQAENLEEADRGEPAPRNLYNHNNWPSPRAKVFVQKLRERHTYRRGPVWSEGFKAVWQSAGNTEYKLTHANCLRYLAYRCNNSLEQFLERTPEDVNKLLFGENFGIPGFFTKRYGYF